MRYDKICPITLCYPTFFPSFPFNPPVAVTLKKTTPSSAVSKEGIGPCGHTFTVEGPRLVPVSIAGVCS